MEILGYFLSFFVGLSLSLFGSGGAILALPILTEIFDLSFTDAVPVSLLTVFVVALVASIKNIIQQNINYKVILLLFIFGSIGTTCGAYVNKINLISEFYLHLAFAVLIITSSILIICKPAYQQVNNSQSILIPVLAGLFIGLLTGILGVGGGFLIIPVLILLFNFEPEQAVNNSLLLIVLNSFAGIINYIPQLGSVNSSLLMGFTFVPVLGLFLGNIFKRKITINKKIMGYFLLIVGVYLLIKLFI